MLRLGLAFVFAYAGIASLMHPLEWIGYLPHFLARFISLDVAIRLLAILQIVLAIWLLSGKFRKYAAALAVLMLAGIFVANINQLIVTFRDVGLLFAALALFFLDA